MTENTKQKKPFFFGWVIVAACLLIQAVPYGLIMNVHPQFIKFVTEGEGISLTQFSLLFTIGTVVSAIVSPTVGKIMSNPKAKLKLIFLVGAIMCGGGFALFSFAGSNIWAYYGIGCLVQVGIAILSSIGVPTLINAWFKENKGFAMGLAFAGGGIGNAVLQPLAANLLNNPSYGYKRTYLLFGIIALVATLPIILFMVRLPKNEAELEANVSKKNESKKVSSWGYTFKEATKLKGFWLVCIGFIFVGLYVSGMAVQYQTYLYKVGFTGAVVGAAGSIFALTSLFGNLCGGVILDKLGVNKGLGFAGVMVVIGGLALAFAPGNTFLVYIFGAVFGVSVYSYIIGPSYLSGALFGDREFGVILGIVQVFFALGYAVGIILFSMCVGLVGYKVSWFIVTAYAVIAYGSLMIGSGKILKYNKETNATETKKIA